MKRKQIPEYNSRKAQKRYYKKHYNKVRKRVKRYMKEHYKRNKALYRKRAYEYARKHKTKIKEYSHQYSRSLSGKYSWAKYICKRRKVEWDLSFEVYSKLITNKHCYYCKGKLNETGIGLDRRNPSKGYILNNVLPCCKDCNTIKNNFLTVDETRAVIRFLQRYRKRKKT